MPPALDVLWVLLLIGLAICVGGLLLRHVAPAWLMFGAVAVAFGFGIPALVTHDHQTETGGGGGGGGTAAAESTPSTPTPSGATGAGGKAAGGGGTSKAAAGNLALGKQTFTQDCGTCHTLADAGTNGKVGPVLDQVKPNEALVLSAIKKGGLGSGTMPANIVTGKDAQAVAQYVSSVAGK